LQSPEDYAENLQQVRHILKGNMGETLRFLKAEMMELAAALKFEKAAVIKSKIDALRQYQSKSVVVNAHLGNIDVATIISDEDKAYCHYMMVSNGSIIYAKSMEIDKKLEETDRHILSLALAQLRDTYQSTARELVVPFPIDVTDSELKVTMPKAGDKKKLLELSAKNLELFRAELKKKKALLLEDDERQKALTALAAMQQALHLTELPVQIECFDNSNFQGAFPVAAMVCFKNGLPDKKEYRRFHIKTVQGINDFASMSEIVYRRYKRLLDEQKPLPQLVIIDGGKGQLSAALESIQKLGITGRMPIIGLAKREESIFFPGDSKPLQLPYDHPAHLLIRRIRDEVHRFGITFHRNTRSKGTIKNILEDIPGIGTQTATELLQTFRSVANIRTLTERELTRIVGAKKARLVWSFFQEDKDMA
jgi:excinuclease ABC subunit C